MSYFEGPVGAAVVASREGFKPIIVLLAGRDEDGTSAEQFLFSQAEAEHMSGSILLRLNDDLASSDPCYSDARSFRTFCPTDELPTVAMVSPSGGTLVALKGRHQCCDGGSLHAALSSAFKQVKQQQQALLAAQAFAALAQRAQQQQQGTNPPVEPEVQVDSSGPQAMRQAAVTCGPPAASNPAEAAAAPIALRVRVPSGAALALEMKGSSTLGEVFAAVDHQRSRAGQTSTPYLLVTAPPSRRQLGPQEAGSTLSQLGITHNALLTLAPSPEGHRPPIAAVADSTAGVGAVSAEQAPTQAAPVEQGGLQQGQQGSVVNLESEDAGRQGAAGGSDGPDSGRREVVLQIRLTNGER